MYQILLVLIVLAGAWRWQSTGTVAMGIFACLLLLPLGHGIRCVLERVLGTRTALSAVPTGLLLGYMAFAMIVWITGGRMLFAVLTIVPLVGYGLFEAYTAWRGGSSRFRPRRSEIFIAILLLCAVVVFHTRIRENYGLYREFGNQVLVLGYPSDMSTYMGTVRSMLAAENVRNFEFPHLVGMPFVNPLHPFTEYFAYGFLRLFDLAGGKVDVPLFMSSTYPALFSAMFLLMLVAPVTRIAGQHSRSHAIFTLLLMTVVCFDFHVIDNHYRGLPYYTDLFSNFHSAIFFIISLYTFRCFFECAVWPTGDATAGELLVAGLIVAPAYLFNHLYGLVLFGAYGLTLVWVYRKNFLNLHRSPGRKRVWLLAALAVVGTLAVLFEVYQYLRGDSVSVNASLFSFDKYYRAGIYFDPGQFFLFNRDLLKHALPALGDIPGMLLLYVSAVILPAVLLLYLLVWTLRSVARPRTLIYFLGAYFLVAAVLYGTVTLKSARLFEIQAHLHYLFNHHAHLALVVVVHQAWGRGIVREFGLNAAALCFVLIAALFGPKLTHGNTPFSMVIWSRDFYDLIQFVHTRTPENSVFLHSLNGREEFAFVSGFGQRRVVSEREAFFGEMRSAAIKKFFSSNTDLVWKESMLREFNVDYVIFAPEAALSASESRRLCRQIQTINSTYALCEIQRSKP